MSFDTESDQPQPISRQLTIPAEKPKKSNFIEDMKKRLNMYHVEKIKLAENKMKDKQWYQQEIAAKNELMDLDDLTLLDLDNQLGLSSQKTEEITGWNHDALKNKLNRKTISIDKEFNRQRNNYFAECNRLVRGDSRELQSSNRLNIAESKYMTLEIKNSNKLIYLKELLNKLESPSQKESKSNRERCKPQMKKGKLKTQETVGKIQKSKLSLHKIHAQEPETWRERILGKPNENKICPNADEQTEKSINQNQNRAISVRIQERKQIQRGKLKAMDVLSRGQQSQNSRPLTIHSQKANKSYQKIKRKSTANQYDIDIAHQKDILQQLIRGSSGSKGNYYSQKNEKKPEKFTLKNLLY